MSIPPAVKFINQKGALLVFPIDNRPEPSSLWSCFYPRSPMRWDWDESGDGRVVKMWHLRTQLSTSKKVVYSKWYRGRATFFSRSVFTAILASLGMSKSNQSPSLNPSEKKILRILEENSPLSTKVLKKESGLRGKDQESLYQKSLKTLWERALIVGFGEVDDGAFPSLALGATQLLYDDLWEEACSTSMDAALSTLEPVFQSQPLYQKEWNRIKNSLGGSVRSKKKGIIYGKDLLASPRH